MGARIPLFLDDGRALVGAQPPSYFGKDAAVWRRTIGEQHETFDWQRCLTSSTVSDEAGSGRTIHAGTQPVQNGRRVLKAPGVQTENDIMAKSGGPSAPVSDAEFLEWVPDGAKLHIWLTPDEGHWFALVEEFDITGMGATQDEAIDDARELVDSYLMSYMRDGAPYKDALRPIPLRMRLEIKTLAIVGRVVRLLPTAGPGAHEERIPLRELACHVPA